MKCLSPSTTRLYGLDLRRFDAWCCARQRASLPASDATLAEFVRAEREIGIADATIGRRVAAIRTTHRRAGFAPPAVPEKSVSAGVRPGLSPPFRMPAAGRCDQR
jgi:hypothetical protein